MPVSLAPTSATEFALINDVISRMTPREMPREDGLTLVWKTMTRCRQLKRALEMECSNAAEPDSALRRGFDAEDCA